MRTLLCIVLLSANAGIFTMAAGQPTVRPVFTISHVNRDLGPYIELISSIYNELGFQVVLLPAPAARGIRLLNDGMVDADVVVNATEVVNMPNIVLVKPALNAAHLALFCVKTVQCNANILQLSSADIAANTAAIEFLETDEIAANIVFVNFVPAITELLKSNKISYGLLFIDNRMEVNVANEFNVVKLKRLDVFHALNKKHIDLIPRVEGKLREKLPEFRQSRQ
jgi:hypothetical protein